MQAHIYFAAFDSIIANGCDVAIQDGASVSQA